MVYKYLSGRSKRYINDVVEELRQKYVTKYGIDFHLFAKDKGIIFLETDKVGGEISIRINERDYVFVPKYFTPSFTEYMIAHGFGHRVLQHFLHFVPKMIEEDEADYFAERLTGISKCKIDILSTLETICSVLRRPVKLFKYEFGLARRDLDKLITKIDSELKK